MMLRCAPLDMRKEHTPAGRITFKRDGLLKTLPSLSYASRKQRASDRRHVAAEAKRVASRHVPAAKHHSAFDRFSRGLHPTRSYAGQAADGRGRLPGL